MKNITMSGDRWQRFLWFMRMKVKLKWNGSKDASLGLGNLDSKKDQQFVPLKEFKKVFYPVHGFQDLI